MQKLIDATEKVIESESVLDGDGIVIHDKYISTSSGDLQIAANKWACHALNTYAGKRLKKALKIAEAMSEFTALDINAKADL